MVIALLLAGLPQRSVKIENVSSIRAYLPFVAETGGAMLPEAFVAPMLNFKGRLSKQVEREFLGLLLLGGSGPKFDKYRTRLRIVFRGGELLMDVDGLVRLTQGKKIEEYALPAFAYNRAGVILRVTSP